MEIVNGGTFGVARIRDGGSLSDLSLRQMVVAGVKLIGKFYTCYLCPDFLEAGQVTVLYRFRNHSLFRGISTCDVRFRERIVSRYFSTLSFPIVILLTLVSPYKRPSEVRYDIANPYPTS